MPYSIAMQAKSKAKSKNEGIRHSLTSPPFHPKTFLTFHPTSLQSNRRHTIQHPRHLIHTHLRSLHTPHLTPLPQALEALCQFPALALVDEEDVFLAICIADRGAENM
jgi:hypothetical protein